MIAPTDPSGPLTIQAKIRQAKELFETWGHSLEGDPAIGRLSRSLEQKAAASGKVMYEVGVIDMCRHCDEEEGGSCCGAGIEDRYNSGLLLLNLLWGVSLPEVRYASNSCYFLGRSGCTLKVRHILCINYLCLTIQRTLPHNDLIRLQTVTGEEMDTIFLLHEAVKRHIGFGGLKRS